MMDIVFRGSSFQTFMGENAPGAPEKLLHSAVPETHNLLVTCSCHTFLWFSASEYSLFPSKWIILNQCTFQSTYEFLAVVSPTHPQSKTLPRWAWLENSLAYGSDLYHPIQHAQPFFIYCLYHTQILFSVVFIFCIKKVKFDKICVISQFKVTKYCFWKAHQNINLGVSSFNPRNSRVKTLGIIVRKSE